MRSKFARSVHFFAGLVWVESDTSPVVAGDSHAHALNCSGTSGDPGSRVLALGQSSFPQTHFEPPFET